ncbi:hypothetical protein OSTOST_16410 [Ostertagia ostertagi]
MRVSHVLLSRNAYFKFMVCLLILSCILMRGQINVGTSFISDELLWKRGPDPNQFEERNSNYSYNFLLHWSNYEIQLPQSFHGSDMEPFTDYDTLSIYEVCMQMILMSNQLRHILILPKRVFVVGHSMYKDSFIEKNEEIQRRLNVTIRQVEADFQSIKATIQTTR